MPLTARAALHASAAITLFALVCTAACREVVSGENLDVREDLCQRVSQCFGPDLQPPSCAVERGEGGGWTTTLVEYDEDCVDEDNCGVVRACVDLPAFCVSAGDECDADFQCCGASSGLGECTEGACCKEAGAPCELDEPCCDGLACTQTGDGKRCGGVICGLNGEPCDGSSDCCSDRCGASGVCEKVACLGFGEACPGGDGCCEGLVCDEGACAVPPNCADPGEVCDPLGDGCCDETITCRRSPGGTPRCVQCGVEGLDDEGFDCAQDADCCGDCVAIGGTLRCTASDCRDTGDECAVSTDCCSGVCAAGACQEGACLQACHSPCAAGLGLPLDDDCEGTLDTMAIQAVVEDDAFCLCDWDLICADAYQDLTGACP